VDTDGSSVQRSWELERHVNDHLNSDVITSSIDPHVALWMTASRESQGK
jgi:hypothetical protein